MGNKCEGCKHRKLGKSISPCVDCMHDEYCRTDNFEPAEPVVLSVKDLFVDSVHQIDDSRISFDHNYLMMLISRAHQNGRLERDLELRGLVESIQSIDWEKGTIDFPNDSDSFVEIAKQVKNLKPLNKD